MQAPKQVKPVPRNFMQEIIGRQWTTDAQQRTMSANLPVATANKTKTSKRKKAPESQCLRQLMTFAVRS